MSLSSSPQLSSGFLLLMLTFSLALTTPVLSAILAQHRPQPFQGSLCRPKSKLLILAHQASLLFLPASPGSHVTPSSVLTSQAFVLTVHPFPKTQQAPRCSLNMPDFPELFARMVTSPSPVSSIRVFQAGPSSPLHSWQQPKHPFTGTLCCPPCLLQ